MKNLANFSQELFEVSKLWVWWDCFIQSRKRMSLKFTVELWVITMRNDANIWRGIELVVQNWRNEFEELWPEHSKILPICTLMGCFRPKYMIFDLKKVHKNYADSTEGWCKIFKKIENGEFSKFSPDNSEVSKLGLWWDPFIQSRKHMSLKFTGELCVMAMRNNAKFGEELSCQFKIDIMNLTNFDRALKNC